MHSSCVSHLQQRQHPLNDEPSNKPRLLLDEQTNYKLECVVIYMGTHRILKRLQNTHHHG